jgi:Protein of unknown function (DUF3738)
VPRGRVRRYPPIRTVNSPNTITPPCAVMSIIRAAGKPQTRTVKDPNTITSGGPTHVNMSVTRACGSPPVSTVTAQGGRMGPPTCGTSTVNIGQTCMSVARAAGNMLSSISRLGLQRKPEPLCKASFSKPGTVDIRCNRCTLSHLAAKLSNLRHESVIDLSGVAGAYDISYTIELIELATRAANKATNRFDEDLPPLILVSLRQLGLRLARQVAPVETLVVDQVTHPSEN